MYITVDDLFQEQQGHVLSMDVPGLSRIERLLNALFSGPFISDPCALCHKDVVSQGGFPEPYEYAVRFVEFADYDVQRDPYPFVHKPSAFFTGFLSPKLILPQGVKSLCGKHITIAKSLAHLDSEFALKKMEQEFGPFPNPAILSPWEKHVARTFRQQFVLPGKRQRLKWIYEALFVKDPLPERACALCHEEVVPEENFVLFHDDLLLSDGAMPKGDLKYFCHEHFHAAQALSHLNSQQAIEQLNARFGTFLQLVVTPPPTTFEWLRDFLHFCVFRF
jgi:hypothetical protein